MLKALVKKVEPLKLPVSPSSANNDDQNSNRQEANAEYHQTYRRLLHHAELLGNRSELRTAMKSGRTAAIFNGTNDALKECGAITPRPKTAGIVLSDSTISLSFLTGTEEEVKSTEKTSRYGSQEKRSNNEHDFSDDDDIIGYNPDSPRAIFLAGCVQQRIPPRSIAMLRKRFSPKLNLAHMSIGNKIAYLLADALVKMPFLQVLNLADNNLDDSGLEAIIRAAAVHGTLEEIDISHNVVDFKTADALADYIGHAHCKLKTLRMSSAGIDDRECARFVAVLMKNRNLTELDMSKNLLGKDENLNVVKPDFVTGGESLSALLRDSCCPLSTLVLHWNMIRLEGAEVLCDSIRGNMYLTHLDLSYNALGSNATCILGEALMENNKLRHLNVANNNIDSVGAMTLSVSLRENWSVREVILDGNPIGEQGVRALMKVVAQEGHRVAIRTLNCDMVCKGSTKLMLDSPVGDYFLNLTRPSERAIAYELLNIMANDMNFELSICDLHMVDQPGKSLTTSTSTLGPTAKEGGSIENITFPVSDLGPPTYSYQVFRFDEPKPREHMSVDELEEEKFLEVLTPLIALPTKAVVWEVKKYEVPHTHNVPVQSLPHILNGILLHSKLRDDSPYKLIREKSRQRSLGMDMATAVAAAAAAVTGTATSISSNHLNSPKKIAEHENENDENEEGDDGKIIDLDSAILSLDSMIASLVDDVQRILDPRNSGLIDIDVFIEYITQRAKVAKVRLHQLRHTSRCAVKEKVKVAAVPKTPSSGQRPDTAAANHNNSTDTTTSSSSSSGMAPVTPISARPGTAGSPKKQSVLRYIPPHSGWLHMKLIESFDINGHKGGNVSGDTADEDTDEVTDSTSERPGGYALSKAKCARFVEEMKKATKSQPLSLLMFALENTWLRLEEAKTIYTFGRNKTDDPTLLLSVIITRMLNSFEARRMVQFAVGDDILKLRRLKQRLGSAYYPLLGVYTGYYNLDLSNPVDRKCLKSLIEKSMKDQEARRKNGLWDTSQHGQWSSFRNEYFLASKSAMKAHVNNSNSNRASTAAGNNNASASIYNDGDDENDLNNNLDDDSSLATFSATSTVNQALAGYNAATSTAGRGPTVVITPKYFVPIPTKGRIEFDFVNLHRPEDIAHRRAIHESIIIDSLLLSHLMEEDEVEWAYSRLHDYSKQNRRSMLPLGNPAYQPSMGRAYTIASELTKIYTTISQRQKLRREGFNRESTSKVPPTTASSSAASKAVAAFSAGSAAGRRNVKEAPFHPNPQYVIQKLTAAAAERKMPVLVDELVLNAQEQSLSVTSLLEHTAEQLGTSSILKNKRLEPQNSRDIRFRSFLHQGPRAALKISQWGHRMQEVIVDGDGSNEFKASAVLEYFEAELSSYWLECRYLALILDIFGKLGSSMRSSMGSYRVELIIVLFDRLIDIQNLEIVLAELTAPEHAALIARIGILNIFNPSKCEGGWSLNLSRWEERQVAKILVHMSLAEPGQNWLNQVFALYRDSEPVPAWQLNRVWFLEEGLPKKGTISFEMYAGQGLRLNNCKVDIVMRQMLSALAFTPQRDFTSELYGMVHHPAVKTLSEYDFEQEEERQRQQTNHNHHADSDAGYSWQARKDRMEEHRFYTSLHAYHGIFLHMINMREEQYATVPPDILVHPPTHQPSVPLSPKRQTMKKEKEERKQQQLSPPPMLSRRGVSFMNSSSPSNTNNSPNNNNNNNNTNDFLGSKFSNVSSPNLLATTTTTSSSHSSSSPAHIPHQHHHSQQHNSDRPAFNNSSGNSSSSNGSSALHRTASTRGLIRHQPSHSSFFKEGGCSNHDNNDYEEEHHHHHATTTMMNSSSSLQNHITRGESFLYEKQYEHSHDRDVSNRYPPATRFTVEDVHDHLRANTEIEWNYTSCNRKPPNWLDAQAFAPT